MVLSSSPLILIEITFLITIQRSLKSVFDFPLNAKSWAWSLSLPINVEKFIHSCCSNWTSNLLFQLVPINKINFCKCSNGFSIIPNEFDATVCLTWQMWEKNLLGQHLHPGGDIGHSGGGGESKTIYECEIPLLCGDHRDYAVTDMNY